ncbi:hypothetical protein [Flavobacterium sp. CSZ]|uniref:hypothetical protein n=1 Tax=Flavobacterium sp. CSZ TaxID=2783791 RepID=UPI00188CAF8C|nr:hypothetical protein [Flavobacterium sp. CSZ]MBF4484439.1 hypothetical protein [Flavobacterium sp. CSZ]
MEEIFKGATANDKTGTPARIAADIINQNFAYLDAKLSNVNRVVTVGTFVLVEQDLTMYAGWIWQINGVNYSNPVDVVINFPYAATGKQRLDRIVFNTSNTFTKVVGAESISSSFAEPVPADTIDFGIYLVTDVSVVDFYEKVINKATDFSTINDQLYPSIKATKDQLDTKIPISQKGIANGVATLGADGKVPNSQVPALAISETFPVSSEAQMLALSGADQGDVAIRSDISKSFILRVLPSSVLGNWSELLTPTDAVQSVNGQVGVVSLTTTIIPDSSGKRYQTENQKLFNDATSSIQAQLDARALDANVIHGTGNETKTAVLTTYGNNITDGTYNYSESLQAIRNQFAAFFNQPFYASDQGYYVFRPSGTNIPARFYIMPNGTPTGTTSKFEMFNSDYAADYTTYQGFNILMNNSTDIINIGPNRGVSGGARQKLIIGGDYVGSVLQSNVSQLIFNTDNTVNLNPFGGAVSIGTATTDPFAISLDHQVTLKNPVAGQPMRLNIVGNGWAAGIYFGRDAIRTASIATQATTSDLEISTNPTNTGTGLTANIRIWAGTGNVKIQKGGTFTDNGDIFQVAGNASGSVAASNTNHFMRKGEIDTALALKADATSLPTSGTYTPTTSSLVNITSMTIISAIYTKIGNIVTVTIRFAANEINASTLTSFNFTLPVNRTGAVLSYNFGSGNTVVANINRLVTVNFTASTSIASAIYNTPSSGFGSTNGSITFQYDVTQ